LTISGGRHNSTWEYSVAPPQTANGSFTFTATGTAPVLKTSRDANWDVIDGRDFSEISGRCFYFETGEYVNGTVAYTLTLTDAAGLVSSVQARTGIPKLQPPELRCDGISLFNSATILADSGKDAKTVEIVRTGKDHNGGSVAGTELHWQLLQDGSVKKSGSAFSNALLDLEKGAWVIKAWETKAGYDKSDALVCAVKVSTAIRYVSASGNDVNPGTKAAPFATLQKAIEDMGDSSEDWRVIVSGTISNTAAIIDDAVQAKSVTIEGDGMNSTLTGDGSNVVLDVTNLPVNVKDVIINGNGKTGIAITSATVTAENVTITDTSTSPGSFGITVKDSGQFVMKTDCKIEKQTIGVKVVGSSFTMEGGAITGCGSSSNGSGVKVEQSGTFTMTGGAISGNMSTSDGAGVYVDNSTFIMTGGTINNNTATGNSNGGGVYLENRATMFMSGKAAIGIKTAGANDGNEAKNGAGVYVTDSTLYVGYVREEGNAVPDSSSNCGILGNVAAGAGGGVYVANNGIMYITGGNVISSNKADAPTTSSMNNGGGVYVESGCFMHITDGAIIGQNTATGDGGGVYAEGFVTIQNCNISNNQAEKGGGMYLANGSVIYTMSNGYIVDNIARAGGGGIYLEAGNFIMSSGEIKGNKAETAGGGVYVDAGTFTMSGGIIGEEASTAATSSAKSNYAQGAGGGVYVFGNLTMSGGKIAYNYAGEGGGVYVGGGQGCSFEMSGNASVCYNGSSTNGGGVYLDALNNGEGQEFSMAGNAAITGNNASQSGGGIYGTVDAADAISFNGGSITKNSATPPSSAQYYIQVDGNLNQEQDDIDSVTTIVLN
ncbi:MAG: hypothetical protein IJR50_07425, partial [Treponema sp.]|nr:hypothetical protein [Treponema sp.]